MIDRACISISGRCNMRCSYCHFRSGGGDYEDLNISQSRLIIGNMAEYAEANGVERFKVGLLGAGEPLMQFGLIRDIVQSATSNNIFSFYTITNGTLVTDEMLSFFHAERESIELNFSLDGHRELHDLCRRSWSGRGTFDAVMGAIVRYESMFGGKPVINCTVHAKTLENKEKIFSFLQSNGFDKVCFSRMAGGCGLGLDVSTAAFDCFLSEAADQGFAMRQSKKRDSYDCTMYGRKCGVGRTNIFYSGGRIFPCGRFARLDDYVIGRYNTPLEEVEANMGRLATSTPSLCYYDLHVAGERTTPSVIAAGREAVL